MNNQDLELVLQRHLEAQYRLQEQSEARIDRTNEMVCKLAEAAGNAVRMLESVTTTYERHLTTLTDCRDALLAQNNTLIRLHEQDIASNRELRHEVMSTRDRLFELIEKMSHNNRPSIENKFYDK